MLDLLATQAAVAIDHARLMEQIRDARDRLQAILNSTYDGILMFDNRLRLLLANPRAEYILNLSAADHEGQTYLQIIEYLLQEYGPDAVGYTLEEAADLMADIQETPFRVTRRRYELDHPALRAVEEITVPVTGESGEIIGRLFVLRDATQEVEMDQYREELTGMIVHDLRSPLSGIITSLHFAMGELQEETLDLESVQASLNIAFSCAEHQLQLIETLLEINKLASGEMLADLAEVNMADMAQEAIDTVQNRAREADIALSLTAPPDLCSLSADEAILRRVLANLLDNALSFTPDGGRIRIAIRSHPTYQHITVTDTGPGIPEKDRERVFERFVQLNKGERVRGAKGSGLGLTFCKLAVEAHGGRIWADSGPEGGAAFHFTLPTDLGPAVN